MSGTGADGTDVFLGIENVRGGKAGDRIRGGTGPNVLRVGPGTTSCSGVAETTHSSETTGTIKPTAERATTSSRETEAPIACSEGTASMP